RCDIVRRLTGRATNPSVVECDYRAIGGESVDDGGIPCIDVAREMLQQDQRRSGSVAEASIGAADSVAFDVTGRRRFERGGVLARDVELIHVILRMLGIRVGDRCGAATESFLQEFAGAFVTLAGFAFL